MIRTIEIDETHDVVIQTHQINGTHLRFWPKAVSLHRDGTMVAHRTFRATDDAGAHELAQEQIDAWTDAVRFGETAA